MDCHVHSFSRYYRVKSSIFAIFVKVLPLNSKYKKRLNLGIKFPYLTISNINETRDEGLVVG